MSKLDKILRNELNLELKNKLYKFLIQHKFKKKQSNCFFRINNVFIEVIWIQLGQWNGGSFYLHYSKELLCNIFRSDIVYGGMLSARIDRGHDGISWIAKSKKDISVCVNSLINEIELTVLSFFENINTLEKFIVECVSLPNKSCNDILLAVAFSSIDKFNKSWWICEDYKELIDEGDIDESEKNKIIDRIEILQKAIDDNTVPDLLEEWKSESIHSLRKI